MFDKCVKNKIGDVNINNFCNSLISKFKENEDAIKNVNDIDKKYYDKVVKVEDLVNIAQRYKDKKQEKLGKNLLCIYNGNPEITLKLCLEAILLKTNFILNIQDFMAGVNKLIVELVNQILKEYKCEIYLFNLMKNSEIKDMEEKIDKILCIGNTNEFIKMSEFGLYKLDFYPYKSLEIYCENEEYEELQKMVYEYSMTNQYEVEVLLSDSIDNIIGQINEFGNGYCSVLLSKNKEHIKKFKEEVQSEIVCINENPYNKIEFEIKSFI